MDLEAIGMLRIGVGGIERAIGSQFHPMIRNGEKKMRNRVNISPIIDQKRLLHRSAHVHLITQAYHGLHG